MLLREDVEKILEDHGCDPVRAVIIADLIMRKTVTDEVRVPTSGEFLVRDGIVLQVIETDFKGADEDEFEEWTVYTEPRTPLRSPSPWRPWPWTTPEED